MEYQSNKILTMEVIPDALLEKGEIRKYKKDEVLKNLNGSAYILIKGCAMESVFFDNNQQIVRYILKQPCIIGDICTMAEIKNSSIFQFFNNSEVLFINREELINLIKNDDEVFTFIFEYIHKKIMTCNIQIEKSLFLNSEIQLASLFYEFARHFGKRYEDYTLIDFNLSQQLIADLLGVNRTTIFRSINKLIEADLIYRAGRKFIVKDLEALFKFIYKNKYNIREKGEKLEILPI